ncbi:MAG: hypothetical protein ACKOTD_11375 [Phycisphaerales bacterium]
MLASRILRISLVPPGVFQMTPAGAPKRAWCQRAKPSPNSWRICSLCGVLPCFHAVGRGAIVTASRSVIYAFDAGERDWTGAVRRAAERFRDEISAGLGVRA